MNQHPFTIREWKELYQGGVYTPRDLIFKLISGLDPHDPALILVCPDWFVEAQLQQLEKSDHHALPLYGVPFVVKDNIDVAGLATTAACPEFAYIAKENAQVVDRLMQAGAILIGKTNLDQFATGLVGTRSPFGAVPNTFDARYISGGSSSGSASMVARGIVPFSLGTDTAGSGRIPAGLNNIVGLKATPGKVPMKGVLPACKTIDVVSIFSLTVADAGTVLSIIEELDDTNTPPRFVHQNAWFRNGEGLPKLGIPANPLLNQELGYQKAFEHSMTEIKQQFSVTPINMTLFDQVAQLLYEGPWVAERFITIEKLYQSNPDAIDPTVKKVIEKALQFDAITTFKKQYELEDLKRQTQAIWREIDVLVVPTTPTCPTLEAVAKDPILRNSELGAYTNFVNLLGLCAIAIPASMSDSGLPFGITLIAPHGYDHALVKLASFLEKDNTLLLGKNLRSKLPQDQALNHPLAARPTMEIAVVGAHLKGMPLHYQIQDSGCQLVESTFTAKEYRLFALANTIPPKPGLVRVEDGGTAIEVEVYQMPLDRVGEFLNLIPTPLGLGSIKLESGKVVKGFICEPIGIQGAKDISEFGGWRGYLNHAA
ncbi:allophanate hydrolase [Polynucleobacter kasalickyi]|uniref:Allophanate hydrolase n=1 Tax=Polynucleobacter kasalickyi TaxID=1938817 RepID=A0A1W1Z6U7_9BURK|nr:allophanate hydrolase [Polynucleobacter kasalickyi]SMC44125.1 allophanate hydrolase [Polynucleobacter kasalickyi]